MVITVPQSPCVSSNTLGPFSSFFYLRICTVIVAGFSLLFSVCGVDKSGGYWHIKDNMSCFWIFMLRVIGFIGHLSTDVPIFVNIVSEITNIGRQ